MLRVFATSGHNQLLTGSDTATCRLFMDFDADEQLLWKDRERKRLFSKVSMIYV
jgi:hypothetical protein